MEKCSARTNSDGTRGAVKPPRPAQTGLKLRLDFFASPVIHLIGMRSKLILLISCVVFVFAGCKRSGPSGASSKAIDSAETSASADTTDSSLIDTNEIPIFNPKKAEARDALLKWNRQTLGKAYDQTGDHDRKWDAHVRRALEEYALYRAEANPGPHGPRARNATELAMNAGCKDGLIVYINARFSPGELTEPETANRLIDAALRLYSTKYHPIRRFYGSRWAMDALRRQKPYPQAQAGGMFDHLITDLQQTLADKGIPDQELYELGVNYIDEFCWSTNGNQSFDPIEPALMAGREKSAVAHFLKGRYLYKQAWASRGGGYADKVSTAGFAQFEKKLRDAEASLTKAWSLDDTDYRIATLMIEVAIGLGYERPAMEIWFDRAMKTNPGNYDACYSKMRYLMPVWHGSYEEMIAFGRACVESKGWRGRVPLILIDAHAWAKGWSPAKETYWLQPAVWPDLHASFEKFFQLNPNAVSWHHNYAWHANACQQWEELQRQLDIIAPRVNYDYFGGYSEFEKMQRNAAEKTGRTPDSKIKAAEVSR